MGTSTAEVNPYRASVKGRRDVACKGKALGVVKKKKKE